MSRDTWFREYERLYNERDAGEITGTDEQLANMASEAEREAMADRADDERKRREENGT